MSGLVEKIADAVLYEGYILYPYRSSAVKNRQRWNFGVLYPPSYREAQGDTEPCEMETQCLAIGGPLASLTVKVRCLRLVERTVGVLAEPVAELALGSESVFQPAESMQIAGRTYQSWQEAAECEMTLSALHFADLEAAPAKRHFSHPPTRTTEPVRDPSGMVAGVIARTQEPLECDIEASLTRTVDGIAQINVRVSNGAGFIGVSREAALARSLLSAHTILRLQAGEFVSLLDPPTACQQAASACHNRGTWPVLAGEPGVRDTVLSSPIILYDYPQIAPESPGDLFDGAEIDEILSLRILTLTDDEKQEMRRSDDRARRILERTEALPPEHFMKLHGALRDTNSARKEAP